jgi:hypothetical protein
MTAFDSVGLEDCWTLSITVFDSSLVLSTVRLPISGSCSLFDQAMKAIMAVMTKGSIFSLIVYLIKDFYCGGRDYWKVNEEMSRVFVFIDTLSLS